MENKYGLLLRRSNLYGTEYLVAELVRREGDHHAPRNCSDGVFSEYGRPKHLARYSLDSLQMKGFIGTSTPNELIGFEPAYYDVHVIRKQAAHRMAHTLQAINNQITKDSAYNAVDCFTSMCKALRLSFVVERKGADFGSSYDNNQWRWMTVGEGRNRYRHLIEEMVAETVAAA
jgi:hypothetical protein